MLESWKAWTATHWERLCEGKAVVVYPGSGPVHPAISDGWREIFLAEPFGQKRDYALSLNDGSRLHLHEYSDRWEVHRDEHDPANGIISAARHFVAEAPTAKLALGGGFAWLCYKAAKRILLPCFAGVLGFVCSATLIACHDSVPTDAVPISERCEKLYVQHVARWALELTEACAPKQVEDCGAPKDAINAKWEAEFDRWEKECSE